MNNITLKYALEIIDSPEFQQLQQIGGGRQYHQEGSAFVHSLLVFNNSFEFWQDSPMNIIALLHDIGKIYTGRQKENDDWEYPNHAKIGASHLLEFLPAELQDNTWFCKEANYYIANHIKPLFWDQKGYPEKDGRTINLAKLAICDLKGSFSEIPQDDKIRSLCDYIAEGLKMPVKAYLFLQGAKKHPVLILPMTVQSPYEKYRWRKII